MNTEKVYACPVDAALGVIGGKYKTIILYHLIDGKMRFNEIQKTLINASHKVLTQQLRELEADGLILRTVYPTVPPKTEYELTEFGKTLIPALEAICEWSRVNVWPHVKQRENQD